MSIKEFLNVYLCEQLWHFQERIRNLSPDHRLPDDSDVLFLICSGCMTAQREMPHSGCRHELAVMVMKCWWWPQKSFCWESCQFKVGWWLNGNNTALSHKHLKQGRCAYVGTKAHVLYTHSISSTNQQPQVPQYLTSDGDPQLKFGLLHFLHFFKFAKKTNLDKKNGETWLYFILYSRTPVSVHSRVITILEFSKSTPIPRNLINTWYHFWHHREDFDPIMQQQ